MTKTHTQPGVQPAARPAGATTKAWTFSARGDPKTVLVLDRAIPKPSLPPACATENTRAGKAVRALLNEDWVLVRVAWAALNPGTFFHVRMVPTCAHAVPAVPEMDFSGVVEDVWSPKPADAASAHPSNAKPTLSSSRARFAKGDAVIGFIPVSFSWPTGTGALAGHIALPARFVVRKPEGTPLREAGGLMLASLVARQVLVDAQVKRGDRVLVNGASGGIGSFGVQMARDAVGKEGHVVAVCSGRNADMVKSLGADEVIDYTQYENLPAELGRRYATSQRFDAVMDCIGVHSLFVGCAEFLKEDGVYGSVGVKLESWTFGAAVPAVWKMMLNKIWPLAPWLGGTGRAWKSSTVMSPTVEDMELVARMFGEGTIRTAVDSEWDFEDAPDSYAVLWSGRASGKILIKVNGDSESR